VMEHREPSRTIAEDPASRFAAPSSPRRLEAPRPESPPPRRIPIARTRAGIAAAIVVGVLVGLYLGYRALCAARKWLADQPAYQLDFGAIELDPPPPPWYRGGTRRFVEEVRRLARMPRKVPLLALRKDELEHAFEHSPWTEDVVKVTYPPLGVTVHLVYHQPVALVEISPRERYLIDESATILPAEDVDRDLDEFASQEALITIKGAGLAAPRNPQPGLLWKCRAGMSEVAPGNGQIPAAAKLARFLVTKLRSIDRVSNPALDFSYINPMDHPDDYRGLFLWNEQDKTYVLWGEAPGAEIPGGLDAEEKWKRIYDWSRTEKRRTLPDGHYWRIVGPGLIEAGADRRPPASGRVAPPRRDHGAILTKDPGQRD
jgi:hypothetical protein